MSVKLKLSAARDVGCFAELGKNRLGQNQFKLEVINEIVVKLGRNKLVLNY